MTAPTENTARSILERFRLSAADELVSDVALGRMVRRFWTEYYAAREELVSRPANVIDLFEWLEADIRRKRQAASTQSPNGSTATPSILPSPAS